MLDKVYGGQTSYITVGTVQHTARLWRVRKGFLPKEDSHYCTDSGKTCQAFERRGISKHTKDAFYNGMREEYKPLIGHKVDKPDIRVSDLLQEVRKIEENEARR